MSAGPGLPPLDDLEIHAGMPLGMRRTPGPELPAEPDPDPRAALDRLLLDALSAGPCHVAFSGGRDSSVILAAATAVARREGLPDPVPLTERFPHHPMTHETEWQELVVRHLGLQDWVTVEVGDELDALGDLATRLLRRYGPYLPAPAHNMAFVAGKAGSGTLLTGTGGDEIFTSWLYHRPPVRHVLTARPRRRVPLRLVFHGLPARVRHQVDLRRDTTARLPWLRPGAQRDAERRLHAGWPYLRTLDEGLRYMFATRGFELTRAALTTFAADAGVRLVEPFWEPASALSVARASPRRGYRTRDEALEALFADLLPPQVLRRSTKAIFTQAAVGPRTRAFAETWDGRGVDHDLVDAETLRAEWLKPVPDARSRCALQHAWLARH